MGNFFTTLMYNWVWKHQCGCGRDYRVIVLGLDNAGKTTILYQLKLGEVVETIPTIGFNVETIQYKQIQFTAWDIGGQAKIRQLWKFYYQNTRGIIYVIDSADKERIEEAKTELHSTLKEEELVSVPLLVFANKQDLPNAIPPEELSKLLDLDHNGGAGANRKWHVQPCDALKSKGLYDGLEWLAKATAPNHGH